MPSRLSENARRYLGVYVLVHLLRRESSERLTPTAGEKYFQVGESGTVVPLLTSAASAP